MYGRVNGKIVKRKNKTGFSYNFLIVKNQRSFMTGKAEYEVVWNFGTIRSEQLSDTKTQLAFWKEVAQVLTNLIDNGKIYRNCGGEIKAKFTKYVPLPVVKSAAPTLIAQINSNAKTAGERLRERFKGLL
jgi:hypothetical protein